MLSGKSRRSCPSSTSQAVWKPPLVCRQTRFLKAPGLPRGNGSDNALWQKEYRPRGGDGLNVYDRGAMRPHLPFSPAILIACAALGLTVSAGPAAAQALGTFRWQQQPYCNLITLTVVQHGGIYHLDGFDDQCGAGTRAAATGLAFPNPNGSIGFGLTVVTTPGGTPLHIDATIALANLSGSWRDNSGATGAWTFTPGGPVAGSPRPVLRAAFPAGLSAGSTTITNVATPVNATDAATKDYVDTTARSLATLAMNVSAYGSRVGAGTASDTASGCLRFGGAAFAQLQLDLPLPFGAVPTSVTVKYVDSSTSSFTLDVRTYEMQEGANRQDNSAGSHASTNGAVQGNRVQEIATPGAAATSASRGYYLAVTAPAYANGDLAFCGAQVSYTLP